MENRYKNITKVCLVLASVLAITACSKKKNTTAKQTTNSNVTTKANKTTASKQTTAHVHSYGEWQITDSTCTAKGEKKKVCSCGDEIKEEIVKKSHVAVTDEAVATTCTTTGLTEGSHCSLCKTVLVAQEEIEKIDHIYKDGKCTMCGKSEYYTTIDDTSIYFGYYPQTKESNETIIATLNTKAGTLPTSENTYNWTDYGYYISNSVSSYMYYIDIDLDEDGRYDYRGIYFTSYRPNAINMSSSESNSNQNDNGYNTNTVYYFKYEQVKWNILKTDNGKALIVSDLLLDSQDYNYTYSKTTVDENTIYANNYMYSHIRSWLNDTFYNTAFNDLEKSIINQTIVDNSASTTENDSNQYACDNTNDYIFLLSYKEITTYYTSNADRVATGSDYAKSQGLSVSNEVSRWWLRSPYNGTNYYVNNVKETGDIPSNYTTDTYIGVRPACWITL